MLVLPSELTHRQARGALGMLLQGMRAGDAQHMVVDAGPLQVFDSSVLAVLLECRRQALADRKTFSVKGLPVALSGLAALYGIDSLLPAAA